MKTMVRVVDVLAKINVTVGSTRLLNAINREGCILEGDTFTVSGAPFCSHSIIR
jgi:hypothetical protein